MTRRRFLKGMSALAGGAGLAATSLGGVASAFRPTGSSPPSPHFDVDALASSSGTFPQSIASGDPTATGVILWTRVAPSALTSGARLAVQVAEDAGFTQIVHQSLLPAGTLTDASDYTARVDLDGLLDADKRYYYRFIYDGTATRTGRCRTLPAENANVDKLRLALLTCSEWQNGYYPALGHIANDDNIDFVVHLGDFIYEYNGPASWVGKEFPGREVTLPSGEHQMGSWEDLKYTWRLNRTDEHMQAMLEAHTLIATWDDHEISNDRYYNYDEGRHYGDPDFHLNGDAAALDQFFADGLRAYFAFMPVRVTYDPTASDPLARWGMYRSFRFGNLAELFMLDERWFRSEQPSPQNEQFDSTDRTRENADRTMLGAAQLAWLESGLRSTPAAWKVLGNPVQMSHLGAALPQTSFYFSIDAWDGYAAEQAKVAGILADVGNAIVLTGDLHTYLAGYVKKDYDYVGPDTPGNRAAVEFMTPGVTSGNLAEILEQGGYRRQPGDDELMESVVLTGNPHLKFFNSSRHGYSVVEFTPQKARWEAYVVDKTDASLNGAHYLLAALEVPEGETRLDTVYRASPTDDRLQDVPAALVENDPRRLVLDGYKIAKGPHDLLELVKKHGLKPLKTPLV